MKKPRAVGRLLVLLKLLLTNLSLPKEEVQPTYSCQLELQPIQSLSILSTSYRQPQFKCQNASACYYANLVQHLLNPNVKLTQTMLASQGHFKLVFPSQSIDLNLGQALQMPWVELFWKASNMSTIFKSFHLLQSFFLVAQLLGHPSLLFLQSLLPSFNGKDVMLDSPSILMLKYQFMHFTLYFRSHLSWHLSQH